MQRFNIWGFPTEQRASKNTVLTMCQILKGFLDSSGNWLGPYWHNNSGPKQIKKFVQSSTKENSYLRPLQDRKIQWPRWTAIAGLFPGVFSQGSLPRNLIDKLRMQPLVRISDSLQIQPVDVELMRLTVFTDRMFSYLHRGWPGLNMFFFSVYKRYCFI